MLKTLSFHSVSSAVHGRHRCDVDDLVAAIRKRQSKEKNMDRYAKVGSRAKGIFQLAEV